MIGLLFSVLLVSTMGVYPVQATNHVDEVTAQIQLDESEVSPYAIATETWYSDWVEYVVIQGYNPDVPNANARLNFTYRLYATYRYNELTGKIYGSIPTLFVEVIDAGSTTEEMWVDSIDYDAELSDDGYSITYSNISFIMGASNSYDDWSLIFEYEPYHHPRTEVIPE